MRTLAMLLVLVGCGEDPCGRSAIQAELDAAQPGDVVSIGACRVDGPLSVPAGVTLMGAGPTDTTIVAPPEGIAVTVEGSLQSLSIESDGCAGVVARDTEAVSIIDVVVLSLRGVGVAIEGVSDVEISNLSVFGPIRSEDADDTVPPLPPFSCGSAQLPTHGVVIADTTSADLSDITVSGFAGFGVLAIDSSLTWTGGEVSTIVGAGVEVWGGSASIEGVTISDVNDGVGAIEAFGAVFGGDAQVSSRGLSVQRSDGYGVFQDGGSAAHTGLGAVENGFAGVWTQSATAFTIDGSSSVEDNGFAGVAVLDTTGVMLSGATISRTVERARLIGLRTVLAADGVHSIASEGRIENLMLTDNARAGLLLELDGGTTSSVSLTSLTVSGTGTALGAVAQNGTLVSGWDAEVVRQGATLANDALFTGSIDIAGAVGPPCFPPIDDIATGGIGALVGP